MAETDLQTESARVFISYSRKDSSTAELLRDELRAAGFDAFLDVHDIDPGEKWKDRLGDLIASAEKIVFLISPDSVASDICEWEIDRAERLGKSILPVVVRETVSEAIPGRLSDINFIFYRSEEERSAGLQKLLKALSTDLAWEREKTRVNDLAMRWDKEERPRRLLSWREEDIRALERWRDGHPATSPAPTEAQLAYISESRLRFSRRQSWIRGGLATGLTVMTALAVAAVSLGLLSEQRRIDSESARRIAEIQRKAAETERDLAKSTQSLLLADLANRKVIDGDTTTAALLALEGLPDRIDLPSRPFVAQAQGALQSAALRHREIGIFTSSDGHFKNAVPSSDGLLIAITSTRHPNIEVWDTSSLSLRGTLIGHETSPSTLSWSNDGKKLLSGSSDGKLIYWDLQEKSKLREIFDGFSGEVLKLDWHEASGNIIFTTLSRSKVYRVFAYNLIKSSELRLIKSAPFVFDLKFRPDGEVFSIVLDGSIELWSFEDDLMLASVDLSFPSYPVLWSSDGGYFFAKTSTGVQKFDGRTGERVGYIKHSESSESSERVIFSVGLAKETKRIVTGGQDYNVRLWSSEDEGLQYNLAGHRSTIWASAFSPDEKRLATADENHTIIVWDTESGEELFRLLSKSSGRISALHWTGEDNLITVRYKKYARAWNVEDLQSQKNYTVHKKTIADIDWHPKRPIIASASFDKSLVILDAESEMVLNSLDFAPRSPVNVEWDPSGHFLSILFFSGEFEVRNFPELSVVTKMKGHNFPWGSNGGEWSADGSKIVTSSGDDTVRIWDAKSGKEVRRIKIGGLLSLDSDISPDGKRLATASNDSIVRVWYLDINRPALKIAGHREVITAVSWSPDGERLLTASMDKTAKVWDSSSGNLLFELAAHEEGLQNAEWSVDGKIIVTAAKDGTARVWDAKLGVLLTTLTGSERDVLDAEFNFDGTYLALAVESRISVWNIEWRLDEQIKKARKNVPRCLTIAQRKEYYLSTEPPRWCITGAGLEAETDPSKWKPKWPYRTDEWKAWLVAKDRGEEVELPKSSEALETR